MQLPLSDDNFGEKLVASIGSLRCFSGLRSRPRTSIISITPERHPNQATVFLEDDLKHILDSFLVAEKAGKTTWKYHKCDELQGHCWGGCPLPHAASATCGTPKH